MLRSELLEIIRHNTRSVFEQNTIMTAVDSYTEASNGAKPIVSGSLPAFCKDKQRGKDDECKYAVGSCDECRQ